MNANDNAAYVDGFVLPPRDRHVIDSILEPAKPQHKHGMTVNDGMRCLCLGETGSGKTSLMRLIVYSMIAKRYARMAFIHDTKGIFPEYPQSVQLPNVQAFINRGGFKQGEPPIASFRGDVRSDVEVSAEEVASFGRHIGKQGRIVNGVWHQNPLLVVIEEVDEAASEGKKKVKAPSVLWVAKQGRKVGVSLLGTTQSPAECPLPLLNQSSSIVFFRVTGSDANYVGERMKLDPRLVSCVAGPNGEGLPNYSFVMYIKGQPWDGQIYQLDKRTVSMFE